MTEYDPRIVAPTCLYLASKAEESTVQARLLVFYIKKMCLYHFLFNRFPIHAPLFCFLILLYDCQWKRKLVGGIKKVMMAYT
jgi:Cyclin, N-terminal domain